MQTCHGARPARLRSSDRRSWRSAEEGRRQWGRGHLRPAPKRRPQLPGGCVWHWRGRAGPRVALGRPQPMPQRNSVWGTAGHIGATNGPNTCPWLCPTTRCLCLGHGGARWGQEWPQHAPQAVPHNTCTEVRCSTGYLHGTMPGLPPAPTPQYM